MFETINLTILAAFIPTFFFVSITPGMCMTLAMTMGMAIGFRRTLWMMAGELFGVGLVAASAQPYLRYVDDRGRRLVGVGVNYQFDNH